MTRVLAHYVSVETAALGVFELALSFLIIDVLLNAFGGIEVLGASSAVVAGDATALAALLALTTAGIAATIGLYRPEICLERRRTLVAALTAGIVAFPVLLLVSNGYQIRLTAPVMVKLAGLLIVCQTGILLTHLAFAAVVPRGGMVRRVLVVGSGRRANRLMEMLRTRRGRLFVPVEAPTDGLPLTPAALRGQKIWGVVLASDDVAGQPPLTLLDSKLRGVRVLSDTAFCELHLGRIDLDTIDANWMLCADGFVHGRIANATKRALDLLVSMVLLVLTLPVMLATAMLIRLGSPGPVFYRQQRVGLHGEIFTLYKFRSMTVDAETGGKPRWAQQRDPRITWIGSFVRPMRIDELPQLFNVLLGQMSVIGPRPERPHFVEQLSHAIPFYQERSYVKPGITGWAQVNYPYGASVEDAREKLSYDLYYVKNRSLLIDLLILVSTVRVILLREGAR
ncbi:MAG TPA: exopolysaccharide biosynthesis polyprenyl glycosylphosphotransferase [Acetobacteraceae bacterium]|jgi:exopolysaccharide biosynthesis polyprenyl glycosylphosphotransferase